MINIYGNLENAFQQLSLISDQNRFAEQKNNPFLRGTNCSAVLEKDLFLLFFSIVCLGLNIHVKIDAVTAESGQTIVEVNK